MIVSDKIEIELSQIEILQEAESLLRLYHRLQPSYRISIRIMFREN